MMEASAHPRFPLRLLLDQRHVEVVVFDIDGPIDPGSESTLAPDERERGKRFLLERDRARFMRGRAGLRSVLGACLGVGPASVALRLTPRGKPELALGSPHVRFNVSHSGGRAIVAVALGREVGVDLELMRVGIDHGAVARRFFTPGEQAAIETGPVHGRLAAFYRCWVAKESYLKARGEGLSAPLNAFEVDPTALRGAPRWSALEQNAHRWRIEQLAVGNAYAAALTCEQGDWTPRRWNGLPVWESDGGVPTAR